ncbi:MAG: hypothetical protein ACTS3F_12870 [Phycisphaerales bacterium]
MSDTPQPTPAVPSQRKPAPRWTAPIAMALVLIASSIAWNFGSTAIAASRQPGCPVGPHAITTLIPAGIAAIIAAFAIVAPARRNALRAIVLSLTLALIAIPIAWTLENMLLRRRDGALLVQLAAQFRAVDQARKEAERLGAPHEHTAMLLVRDRHIPPALLLFDGFACPRCPPMPAIDRFAYASITLDDAWSQRVTADQIIDAANATLGDDPWERIGWTWHLRDARPHRSLDPDIIVAGGVLWANHSMAVILTFADGDVRWWRDTDPDLQAKLHAATTAAERLGVAPPPPELLEFVNNASTTP